GSQWSLYPNYNYGWSVPLLCLFLLWNRRRIGSRDSSPEMARPTRDSGGRLRATFVVIGLEAAVLLLPTRMVQEANPGWRLVHWSLAFEVIAITFCVIKVIGGWKWVR